MSTHDNIFDRLLHELQEGDMALADGCRVRIEGSMGQRKAYFLMEEGSYEEGMISDPSWIIDTMRDDIGMRAEELRYKAHDHEYGTEHKLIVGQLQDEGGWALYLMGDLDETGDASGKCRIELIEGATQVQALIDSLNNDVFDRAAQRIMVEVVGATNMEPQALLRLREAMSRLDGGAQCLATWDTVAVQADLEANTSLPKPRRGSGGPGRL